MNCASCGYLEDMHDAGTRRCPLATADKNGRRGTFKLPAQVPVKSWHGLVMPLSPAELAAVAAANQDVGPVAAGPPQVAARPPTGPAELAGYRRQQAVGLGRLAIEQGWNVRPLYWRDHAGVEGCGVWLNRGPLRALATWKRPAGVKTGTMTGWSTDLAYAWRADLERLPARITHTRLEELINGHSG